jgi:alpha-D-xyloside xylohydrolase
MRSLRVNRQLEAFGVFALVVARAGFGAPAPQATSPQPQVTVQSTANGFVAFLVGETLKVTVCNDAVVHIVAYPGDTAVKGASPAQPWMLDESTACPGASFHFAQDPDGAWLTTTKLRVKLEAKAGNLVYSTLDGTELLRERPAIPRTYEPVVLNGEKTLTVEDRFMPGVTEGLYGLGQHQNGMFNYRGGFMELGQDNSDIAVPLMVSNRGYGLLWNTASMTYFDDRYPPALGIRTISENALDYYFIFGPEMDDVIHQYRQMTGHAPMFPEWSYGFLQSKDSYTSQAEFLDIARRYRAEHIPLDCMVQDAGWWKVRGDADFNSNYPDVATELSELRKEHMHTMISVWGLYHDGSTNFETLKSSGWEIAGTKTYDATSPAAQDFFWKTMPGPLLTQGWDSFWLDASEPDSGPYEADALLLDKKLAIGNGAMYTNIYPLLHTAGIAERWKRATQEKRVMLLTRSAFLGQQRVGATVWSGDVYPTNWALQHQIAAGLNFALSGMPYWTTDVAGYFPLYNGATMTSQEYQELYARWFQFGTFCPIFRTHGHRDHNEIWTYEKVEPILLTYDKLRYRMLPYIYSLAWKVTQGDYTMQRPLLMDWRMDHKVWSIGDEYMFGPAFLVSPVWKEGARKREVYLPEAAAWYDFWTGEEVQGKQDLEVDAPLEKLPLFMRAGSIVPLGPEIEYAGQKPSDPIELRVYRGSDGEFNFYEDEGDSYRYEKGAYATIPIKWNDTTQTLTIGERTGAFPGMVERRIFNVVLVSPGHGVGEGISKTTDAALEYSGKSTKITFPSN